MVSPITRATALLGMVAEPKPTKIEDAARQFESILIAQMLRSGRESASAMGEEDESDSGGSTMLEVAEQQFAQMLARQGGLGLARLVTAGLERSAVKD
jgi:Rod binding domain-containing protein